MGVRAAAGSRGRAPLRCPLDHARHVKPCRGGQSPSQRIQAELIRSVVLADVVISVPSGSMRLLHLVPSLMPDQERSSQAPGRVRVQFGHAEGSLGSRATAARRSAAPASSR
jgi:hypothetical protein